jgi:sugar lactone lactonase YvrE
LAGIAVFLCILQTRTHGQDPSLQTWVFWLDIESRTVQRSLVQGDGVEDILGPLGQTTAIALDPERARVYWNNMSQDSAVVCSADLDGDEVDELLGGTSAFGGLAIDAKGGKIYYGTLEAGSPGIWRAALDGSQTERLFTVEDPCVDGIVLDLPRGIVYQADRCVDRVYMHSTNGQGSTLLFEGVEWIAVDPEDGRLYWLGEHDGVLGLHRRLPQATETETLAPLDALGSELTGLTLDPVDRKLYWADRREGAIRRCDLDGMAIEDVVVGLQAPYVVALARIAPPPPRVPGFIRGDSTMDLSLEFADGILVLAHLFLGRGPLPCPDSADVNDNGRIDISDPIHFLHLLFFGGEPLAEPFLVCGSDPTADGLNCDSSPALCLGD